ncbi:hypothetical protein ACERII_06260 [Evansella sp. AB-rgal1]|uniref:hypothetical protein n=1 Tax=Evansella sp. AB-rgal1 TaxID=3242696 RepID=UPI00359DF41F
MISFRGDAHKFYLKIRRNHTEGNNLQELKELQEIKDIRFFYRSLTTTTLENIHYRIIKEKNGSGLIPILVTTVPWILFIFSKQLHSYFDAASNYVWITFAIAFLIAIFISVYIHFKERAWATVHSRIIEDIISERSNKHEY